MDIKELREKAGNLPLLPGVYIMLDEHGEVIYVGKAKALKNRVSQYFQDSAGHTQKTLNMVAQVADFQIIVADSEFEALVLECSLIKRHQPKYNILLKDGKGYPFVRLSDEEYPRFSLSGKKQKDKSRYFGPFGSRTQTFQALDAISEALKLPTCNRKFPRDIGRERPCLYFGMGRCAGWCRPETTQEEYRQRVEQAVKILEGKTAEVASELKEEMLAEAASLRFERAAELRDRLNAIEKLGKRQKVFSLGAADRDVVGYFRGPVKCAFAVLHYEGGDLLNKDSAVLPGTVEGDDREIVSGFIKQYYAGRPALPPKILLPLDFEDREDIEKLLSGEAGSSVRLFAPKSGESLKLIKLASLNAREEAERVTTREEKQSRVLELLGRALQLEKLPRRIEAYDISNTGKSEIVGAMTVFQDAQPRKRDYRSYIIKEQDAQDDYSAMREMLRRRLIRLKAGDKGFETMPDLLLVDGGSVHAYAAKQVEEELGFNIPVFGMVKDDRHRTRAILAPDGSEIGIKQNQSLFSFVGRIQEETHRAAIEFHRKRRQGTVASSSLDRIPGVGPKRRGALLRHFGSVSKIEEASEEELAKAVPKNTAKAVYEYYHTDKAERKHK